MAPIGTNMIQRPLATVRRCTVIGLIASVEQREETLRNLYVLTPFASIAGAREGTGKSIRCEGLASLTNAPRI